MQKCAYKLHALRRIRKYLTVEKAKLLAKLLANAFINSQFTYAPLIWMFAGKHLLLKFVKYTFEHFKLLIIIMTNHMKTY